MGDTFSLDPQWEASEVVTSAGAAAVDMTASTATQPIQRASNVYL
jgi:hypothetical protein